MFASNPSGGFCSRQVLEPRKRSSRNRSRRRLGKQSRPLTFDVLEDRLMLDGSWLFSIFPVDLGASDAFIWESLQRRVEPLDLGTEDLTQLRFEFTDVNGDVISQVEVGDSFLLKAYVEDLRPEQNGVFSFYHDVLFDATQAIAEAIIHSPAFGNAQSGTIGCGLIDEIGSFSSSIVFTGEGEDHLYTVEFVATKAGNFAVTGDQPDVLPAHDVAMFGMSVPVPLELIDFGRATLTIVPASDADGGSAQALAGDVSEACRVDTNPVDAGPDATVPLAVPRANRGLDLVSRLIPLVRPIGRTLRVADDFAFELIAGGDGVDRLFLASNRPASHVIHLSVDSAVTSFEWGDTNETGEWTAYLDVLVLPHLFSLPSTAVEFSRPAIEKPDAFVHIDQAAAVPVQDAVLARRIDWASPGDDGPLTLEFELAALWVEDLSGPVDDKLTECPC